MQAPPGPEHLPLTGWSGPVAAAAVLLAGVPLILLVGALILKLAGENWASWSAGRASSRTSSSSGCTDVVARLSGDVCGRPRRPDRCGRSANRPCSIGRPYRFGGVAAREPGRRPVQSVGGRGHRPVPQRAQAGPDRRRRGRPSQGASRSVLCRTATGGRRGAPVAARQLDAVRSPVEPRLQQRLALPAALAAIRLGLVEELGQLGVAALNAEPPRPLDEGHAGQVKEPGIREQSSTRRSGKGRSSVTCSGKWRGSRSALWPDQLPRGGGDLVR